jgi:hypothetical protein
MPNRTLPSRPTSCGLLRCNQSKDSAINSLNFHFLRPSIASGLMKSRKYLYKYVTSLVCKILFLFRIFKLLITARYSLISSTHYTYCTYIRLFEGIKAEKFLKPCDIRIFVGLTCLSASAYLETGRSLSASQVLTDS